ncbi:unnamed protein product [Camellia sinensis]
MASSSDSMDNTFRARVQKIFGSLSSSSSSSSSSSLRPPWSLTGDEVEKRQWRRPSSAKDDDQTPVSFSFDGLFARNTRRRHDLQDINDDDDQLGGGRHSSEYGEGDGRDEWEIRSSIGLDSTLDNEEEEDEYDKVAEGRENVSDRLYMSDITNHGPYLNSHNVLPSSVHNAPRDPRANQFAARLGLNEEKVEDQKYCSNHTSDDESIPKVEEPHIKASEDGCKLKSILKRKNNAASSKAQKHVRFDPDCKDDCEEASEKPRDFMMGTSSMENSISHHNSLLAGNTPGFPNYVLNPFKYTHYSFDSSSEIDDESNSQACVDLLKLVKMSKPKESGSQSGEVSSHLPITFIPRKKASGARPEDNSSEVKQNQDEVCKQSLIQTEFPLGIAAVETQRIEVNAMEDELETTATDASAVSKKPCRLYRTMSKLEDLVS